MSKRSRQRLSVFLSLLLTAFLFCQGMAKAAILPAIAQPVSSEEMMNCHMDASGMAKATPKADCDMGCQHLDKAYSNDLPSAHWDNLPLIVIFMLPVLTGDTGSPVRLTSLPWHDPPSNIPLPIRLQRFLK